MLHHIGRVKLEYDMSKRWGTSTTIDRLSPIDLVLGAAVARTPLLISYYCAERTSTLEQLKVHGRNVENSDPMFTKDVCTRTMLFSEPCAEQ